MKSRNFLNSLVNIGLQPLPEQLHTDPLFSIAAVIWTPHSLFLQSRLRNQQLEKYIYLYIVFSLILAVPNPTHFSIHDNALTSERRRRWWLWRSVVQRWKMDQNGAHVIVIDHPAAKYIYVYYIWITFCYVITHVPGWWWSWYWTMTMTTMAVNQGDTFFCLLALCRGTPGVLSFVLAIMFKLLV